jgi:hypothetical protein
MSKQDHGHTPAAWTAVTIMLVGFTVAGVAFVVKVPWLFFVGMGVVVLGGAAGKIMQMMGLGQMPTYNQEEAERRVSAA